MAKKTEALETLTQEVRRRGKTFAKLKRKQERAWANRDKTEKLLARMKRMEKAGLPAGTVTETKKISARVSALHKVIEELIRGQIDLEKAYTSDNRAMERIQENVSSFVEMRLDDLREQISASSSSSSRFRTDFTDAPMTTLCTNLFRLDESQLAAAASKANRRGKGSRGRKTKP